MRDPVTGVGLFGRYGTGMTRNPEEFFGKAFRPSPKKATARPWSGGPDGTTIVPLRLSMISAALRRTVGNRLYRISPFLDYA